MLTSNPICWALCLLLLFSTVQGKTSDEWKSRTIYQIITDRFARTDKSKEPCLDFHDYCGGTFKGIINNLDYITGMGFDAIWISPIVENTEKGYHGYWAKDLYKINPYFGTEQDFKDLVQACHQRNVWVMVDVVANHVGPVGDDFTAIVPFSNASFYHKDCPIDDFNNETQVLYCRLSDLPDLAQENEFTRNALLQWIHDLVNKYDIDGLRIDTVPYVPKDFLVEFIEAAGVFCLGEVYLGNFTIVADYQQYVQGVLNYPLHDVLKAIFLNENNSMLLIQNYYKLGETLWEDDTILGIFIDNHDTTRFLNETDNIEAFKSALAFSLMATGIPIVYQGDEQAFTGGDDPANREPLWTAMNPSSEIYQFIKNLTSIRKSSHLYNEKQIEGEVDANFYSFRRGEFFFAFTNSLQSQTRIIKKHTYEEGTFLCNVLGKEGEDCVEVQNGTFPIILRNGEVKIYAPNNEMRVSWLRPIYSALFAIDLAVGVLLKFIPLK